MMHMIDTVRSTTKLALRQVAGWLHKATGGKITPNGVTWFGFGMHIPIAVLIAQGDHNLWAAGLLIVFGLFDTLDGQLARLQKRESARGMLLDSVTDRMKEILLYTGAAYAIIASPGSPYLAVWAVAACGCSLLTSYINAWGDAIMAKLPAATKAHTANKAFRGGLFPFEIRVFVLIVGLISNHLTPAIIVIALGAGFTALSRLARVYGRLADSHV